MHVALGSGRGIPPDTTPILEFGRRMHPPFKSIRYKDLGTELVRRSVLFVWACVSYNYTTHSTPTLSHMPQPVQHTLHSPANTPTLDWSPVLYCNIPALLHSFTPIQRGPACTIQLFAWFCFSPRHLTPPVCGCGTRQGEVAAYQGPSGTRVGRLLWPTGGLGCRRRGLAEAH